MPAQAAVLEILRRRAPARAGWVILLLAVCGTGLQAEEDPYLSAITQEAVKVEAETQPTLDAAGEAAAPTADALSMQAFEEDLKARYVGSYTFYEKLPRRTQEEIFQEYRDGASMDEIRKKIMDRFLHR